MQRWILTKPSYLALAALSFAGGAAICYAMAFTLDRLPLWALLFPVTLFILPAFRAAYLGRKVVELTAEKLVVKAPFWPAKAIYRARMQGVEIARTDSAEVEEQSGKDFEGHEPAIGAASSVGRVVLRQFVKPTGVGPSYRPVPAELIALRFWLDDGTRREILLPDLEPTSSAIVRGVATWAGIKEEHAVGAAPNRTAPIAKA